MSILHSPLTEFDHVWAVCAAQGFASSIVIHPNLQGCHQRKGVISVAMRIIKSRSMLMRALLVFENHLYIPWSDVQEEQEAQMAAQREEDVKRLKRERRVLEKQSQALLRLPGRKERHEVGKWSMPAWSPTTSSVPGHLSQCQYIHA